METRVKYQKKKRKKKVIEKGIWFFFVLICLIVLFFSIFKIFIWNKENNNTDNIKNMAKKNTTERKAKNSTNINEPSDKSDDYWDYIKMDMLSADFDELKKKNSDTVGFIKVNGTNINYPVVQSKDNDYYLNHAYDKSKNSAGWIFADYRNNMNSFDKNTIIYGHGRLNNTMFGSLKNILNSNWYNNKDNYIIKFSTPKENTLWRVFSVYSIKVESYYITTNFNDDEYQEFLDTITSRSKKDFNTKPNINDKILTLSTCKDVEGTERVVMHAKLIKVEKRA